MIRIEIMESLLGRGTRSSAAVYVAEKPAASITGQCVRLKQQVHLKRLFMFTSQPRIRLPSQPLPRKTLTSLGIAMDNKGFQWQHIEFLFGKATEQSNDCARFEDLTALIKKVFVPLRGDAVR